MILKYRYLMKEVKLFNAFLFVNIIMVTFIMNPVFAVNKKDTEIKLFKVLDLKCENYSVKGMIRSSWKKENGSISLNIIIPGNSRATVYVPTKNVKSITESSRGISKVKEIKFLFAQEDYAVYQVGSGTYNFKSTW
jgi:hypothetical protein